MAETKADLKLGNKYECYECSAKFYDLGKPEAVCPKCGADQKEAEETVKPLVTQAVRRRRKSITKSSDDDDAPADIEEIDEDEIDEDLESLEDDDDEDLDDDST